MHIPFDEFEKVMGQCYNVFSTWDDEYEKLQALLRYSNRCLGCVLKKKSDPKLYFFPQGCGEEKTRRTIESCVAYVAGA